MSKDAARKLETVRRILWETWDPIGVNDIPEAFGEYDSYAPTIVSMLAHGCSARDLEFHLAHIESSSIGLPRTVAPHRVAAVAALIALRDESSPSAVPLELLEFESMASGAQSLRLTRKVSWETFPNYAKQIVDLLGGTIQNHADSPVERVWAVTILGSLFWISSDDFGLGVSLDPQDSQAAALVHEIRDRLMALR